MSDASRTNPSSLRQVLSEVIRLGNEGLRLADRSHLAQAEARLRQALTLAPGASREAIDALFAATFRLAHWLFVARDHPSGARPYVTRDAGLENGAPMVKAFTDVGRLQDYVRENKLAPADGQAPVLSIAVPGVLAWLADLAETGVTHIHFNGNRASDDYYLPLVQMPIVHRHLRRLELLPGGDS